MMATATNKHRMLAIIRQRRAADKTWLTALDRADLQRHAEWARRSFDRPVAQLACGVRSPTCNGSIGHDRATKTVLIDLDVDRTCGDHIEWKLEVIEPTRHLAARTHG